MMRSRDDIQRDIKQLASRSFLIGMVVGVLIGVVIGFAVGYGQGSPITVVVPLPQGIKT